MNESLAALSKRCLHCLAPFCEAHCPSKNAIRDILSLCQEGKEEEASRLLYETNPIPEITSLLCDHERQCRGNCVQGVRGEPLPIPEIERRLSAFPRPYRKGKPTGKRVALIGAGPANISAAFFLLQAGHDVVFYEKSQGIGGAISSVIPAFRFDKAPLMGILRDLEELGAEFHFGVSVDSSMRVELEKEYDALLIGVGAEKENMGGLVEQPGIVPGLSYLRDPSLYPAENPVIWGGGNVAIDCARTALRQAGKASIVYRRSLTEMPASMKEVNAALEEGVRILFLQNIRAPRFDEQGHLLGLDCFKMELGEPDSSGRRSPREIPGSDFFLPCDALLLAIGEKPDLTPLGLNSPLPVGENHPAEKIFLAGDCLYGAKNIAEAICSGRLASFAIHRYLSSLE